MLVTNDSVLALLEIKANDCTDCSLCQWYFTLQLPHKLASEMKG